MKVHELVARLAPAGESAEPMNAARQVLEQLAGELGKVDVALDYISGIGGNARQVFYRSPKITLLKVCFPAGIRTPPHDHATWAAILLLRGEEKNTFYRRDNGRLRRAGEKQLAPGSVLTMRADTVHVVECVGETPTVGLHVYGGDILELPRRLWNPETLEEHPLDWALYDTFARSASAAGGAPNPQ